MAQNALKSTLGRSALALAVALVVYACGGADRVFEDGGSPGQGGSGGSGGSAGTGGAGGTGLDGGGTGGTGTDGGGSAGKGGTGADGGGTAGTGGTGVDGGGTGGTAGTRMDASADGASGAGGGAIDAGPDMVIVDVAIDIVDSGPPPPPPAPGRPGFSIVAGGRKMSSPSYKAFVATGEAPGGNGVLKSRSYSLRGGVIGTTQPK